MTNSPTLMTRQLPVAVLGWWLLAVPVSGAQAAAGHAEYQPGMPFTYLFDTGSPSPRPLSRRALAAKEGWTLVPEDVIEHIFQGDAVLVNDKLTLVLRRNGSGAEVYSPGKKVSGTFSRHGPAGASQKRFLAPFSARAVVMAAPNRARAITGIASVRILENHPGAVMVEADFEGDGQSGTSTAAYRLTTGQAMLEMRGGQAADRFFVWSNTRYVVVPDFFADDMVFSAATCDLPRFGLPTENFLLSTLHGGEAIVMCVWRDHAQQAHAIVTPEGSGRVIRGCEIEGGAGATLWVAILQRPDLWHERPIWTGSEKVASVLGWKPPFAARWRADFFHPDGVAESREFAGEQELAEALALPTAEPYALLLYPIDRSRDTPLTVLCPTDVLRNTLGVGPCQYILQSEGLPADTNLTPEEVMQWVVKQFRGKQEVESADELNERLHEMVDSFGRTQARIDEYAALARELRATCRADERGQGVPAAVCTLLGILDELEQSIAAGRRDSQRPARVAELAERIGGLIGKQNVLEECERLAESVRRAGAGQQRTLSKCRMVVRWLKQQARMSAIRDPATAELAGKVRARCERLLQDR